MKVINSKVLCYDDYSDYVVLFLLNGVGMVLELVASRLMSPYFGNSNFVWTAIIGIILLAGSLGNLIGGRLAVSRNARGWAMLFLLFAAIYIILTPLVNAPILYAISEGGMGVQVSSVIGSVVFFLIPSTLLGVITPIIMKERIGEGRDKGKESGRITALIAIGSLVGTFAGGFFLIPSLGTKGIFVLLGILIIITVVFMRPWRREYGLRFGLTFFSTFLFAVLMSVFAAVMLVNDQSSGSISIDTEYGRVIVEDGTYEGNAVRFYRQSGAYSSATFLDEKKKYELVFEYLDKYDEMFNFTDVDEVAMIGGAAYQYPKYYISHFKDKKMDVIEIDPEATRIAKQYFFLGDLIEDYGEDRLGLYNEDGRVFFTNTSKKYDVVLNDAFSGEVPVGTLATREAVEVIKSRLNKDGVYMSNVLGAAEGDKSIFLKAEVNTMSKVFKYVYVVSVYEQPRLDKVLNWVVIATDNDKYQPENTIDLDVSESIVLTDDYNPVEMIVNGWKETSDN